MMLMQPDLIDSIADGGVGGPDLVSRIKRAIIELVDARSGSICPSEAARLVADEFRCEWRDLMSLVRHAAHELVEEGRIEVTQNGRAVELREARGPVRLARRSLFGSRA